ncbi:MAG: hypothetical protein CMD83_00830 [Gammaproteobacteria bacterium]|nr:hypothetical protein [Gammaproteobacteria bacterium]
MLDMGAIGAYVYAGSFGDGPDNTISQSNRPEWTLCVFVDGVMASMFSAIPFTMRANGNAVKMAGVSSVGTLPEYRRRGFVRRVMTEAFERMRAEEQAIASLWASQAAIYQRYQYAMTTVLRRYEIDTVDIGFHDGDSGSGTVLRCPLAEAMPRLKRLYIEHIGGRMCYLHRSSALWQLTVLEDKPEDGPLHVAFCERDGKDVGYVVYTTRPGRIDHRARSQEMKIRDLVALDLDAYRSLWSFIGAHDMVGSVTWTNAPLDDPAPELFAEPRMLHAEDREGLWLRVVDAERALAERGYDGSGTLRIGITEDSLAPWNEGVFELSASPAGATVTRVQADADLVLSPKALALLYTGRRDARLLHAWGLIEGAPDAVARAADIFATRTLPHAPDHF